MSIALNLIQLASRGCLFASERNGKGRVARTTEKASRLASISVSMLNRSFLRSSSSSLDIISDSRHHISLGLLIFVTVHYIIVIDCLEYKSTRPPRKDQQILPSSLPPRLTIAHLPD